MKLRFSDLWRWEGEISRRTYLIWGILLFALKYNLDRLLLLGIFRRRWSLMNYFDGVAPSFSFSPAEKPGEYALLLAAALPFLWAGVVLSLKRLRSAKLPLWLAVLFVAPVLKWFLFLALLIVPKQEEAVPEGLSSLKRGGLRRWYPKSALGSAAVAAGLSAAQAPIGAWIGAQLLRNYGWALFAGIPFCMGFSAALLHGATQKRNLGESLTVAMLSVVLAGVILFAIAFEGLICILMAAPLAIALAVIGAFAGHVIQATAWHEIPPRIYCLPWLAIPLMLATEHFSLRPPALLRVTSSVEVRAPPEKVWQYVVSFTHLPPPTESLFKLGIAYPICAEIQGHGPGAVRRCVFSTGPFVEPIEVWDAPRLLKFSVTQNPAPMEEWTPYQKIHPPHLNGFLVSRQGQFLLTALPAGRTRLEGTTWYRHTMGPSQYWGIWSDYIIHKIHRRVLLHVKNLAEQDGAEKVKVASVEPQPEFPTEAGGTSKGGIGKAVFKGAALAQLGIAVLNLFLVRLLKWEEEVKRMPLLLREVFYVHAWFISITLGVFAVLSWRFAGEMAGGNEVCRWLAGGIGIFWAIRTVLQMTWYSSSHWRGQIGRTAVHVILLLLYGGFSTTYLCAALGRSL